MSLTVFAAARFDLEVGVVDRDRVAHLAVVLEGYLDVGTRVDGQRVRVESEVDRGDGRPSVAAASLIAAALIGFVVPAPASSCDQGERRTA